MKYLFLLVALLCSVLSVDAADKKTQSVWSPAVSDSWFYKVIVEVKKGTRLPAEADGQIVEELEEKTRATYLQKHVYKGLKLVKEGEPKAHTFYVYNGDQLEQIEYMGITEKLVVAIGSKQEGANPKEAIHLGKGIPLVHSAWKGGEEFPFVVERNSGGEKFRVERQFKVIGWESLETAAGMFEAMHIQLTGKNGPMEIKRNFWFAPDIGFIKEVKKYYIGDAVVFAQTRVLEEIVRAPRQKN